MHAHDILMHINAQFLQIRYFKIYFNICRTIYLCSLITIIPCNTINYNVANISTQQITLMIILTNRIANA